MNRAGAPELAPWWPHVVAIEIEGGVPWCPPGDIFGEHPPHDFGLSLDNDAFTAPAGHWRITVGQPATWMPERLARDVAVLDANPAIAAVISNSLYWWMDEDWPACVDRSNAPLNCVWPPRSFFKSVWLRHESGVPCPVAFTVRTALFRDLGGVTKATLSPWT